MNVKLILLSLLTLNSSLLTLSAAVPLHWTVETSRATPVQIEAYQGETLDLEASLLSYGKPLAANLNDCHLYWQTNGMGSVYWTAPAFATNSHLTATWSPTNDVGARVYTCFIGAPGSIYHAAFQLRLRPSPGALPNTLPLPQPVIDFAKVRVLNPPWGPGGIDTNAVRDIIHETVDGAARPLPPYLHAIDFCDSYPEDAAWYYSRCGGGVSPAQCSARRNGNLLERNYDWTFDSAAEFIVRMSAGPGRFSSVGVANVGTNLTEGIATSGKWSRYYKSLPGHTVDGINERGVCAEINVVDGEPSWHSGGNIHPLAAVRWALDNGTSAAMVASNLAERIAFPTGWTQNFHYMVADESETWIVENGTAYPILGRPVMTNFRIAVEPPNGPGIERYNILMNPANSITNAWYTRAYRRETNPPRVSDLADVIAYTNEIFDAWAAHPKEYFRNQLNGGEMWWQTVHTSVYDISNRTLRVAVQECDDWYVFQVPGSSVDLAPLEGRIATNAAAIASHTTDTNNPHQVTAAQVGALRKTGDMMTGDLLLGTKDAESRQFYGVKYVDYSNDPPLTNVLIDLDIGYFSPPLFAGLSEFANVLTAGRFRGGHLFQQINHKEDVGWKVSSFVKDSFYESYLIPDGSDFATMNMLTNANATTCAATSATNSLAWLATTAAARAETNSADIANLTAAKMDKATSAASGYLAVFDADGNVVKSGFDTMGGSNIDANGWIDAHSGFFINGNFFAYVGDNGVCLLSANGDEIYFPEIGGTLALLSDVTEASSLWETELASEAAAREAADDAVEAAAKDYTDSVLGPISTALDAILGGH